MEFEALTVDFDLFDHGMLLTFGKDFCEMIVGVATGWPYHAEHP